MKQKNLIIILTLAVIILAILFFSKQDNSIEEDVEHGVESSGEAVQRVFKDSKDALRGAAEGVNDAVYN